jgi:hypothetical protein
MAASPEWKVHNAFGEYKACCKDVEDAGMLAELYGVGAFIKNKWRGGNEKLYVVAEMIGPDAIAQAVFKRCEEIHAAHEAKRRAA